MAEKKRVAEVNTSAQTILPDSLLTASEPWVARGFTDSWPLAAAGKQGFQSALSYLETFYGGRPVKAILAEPQHLGRFFYNEDMTGFNFYTVETTLRRLFSQLIKFQSTPNAPAVYLGSAEVSNLLPGLSAENSLVTELSNATMSLWIGNQSRVAAHFDFPRNLACCVVGKRRFTLFPPEQAKNLYIGPWDLTPAGQPISLVDFKNPDYSAFPRFKEAESNMWTVDLDVGDALYIPSLWWHQVEGLSAINGLINFWWHEADTGELSPLNTLKSASKLIKALPKDQQRAMKCLFDTYVFEENAEPEWLESDQPQ